MDFFVEIIKVVAGLECFDWKTYFIIAILAMCFIYKVVKPNRIIRANKDLVTYATKVLNGKKTVRETAKEIDSLKVLLSKSRDVNAELFLPNKKIIHKAVSRLSVRRINRHPSEWISLLNEAEDIFADSKNQCKILIVKYVKAFAISWLILTVLIALDLLIEMIKVDDVCTDLSMHGLIPIIAFLYCTIGFIFSYILERIIEHVVIWHT